MPVLKELLQAAKKTLPLSNIFTPSVLTAGIGGYSFYLINQKEVCPPLHLARNIAAEQRAMLMRKQSENQLYSQNFLMDIYYLVVLTSWRCKYSESWQWGWWLDTWIIQTYCVFPWVKEKSKTGFTLFKYIHTILRLRIRNPSLEEHIFGKIKHNILSFAVFNEQIVQVNASQAPWSLHSLWVWLREKIKKKGILVENVYY